MKRTLIIILTTLMLITANSCGILSKEDTRVGNSFLEQETEKKDVTNNSTEDISEYDKKLESQQNQEMDVDDIAPEPIAEQLIRVDGNNLLERIGVPSSYQRSEEAEESLATFLRNYPLKPAESKVLLYDGTEKRNQNAHAAVFDLPIENYDLQQCADSVMRVYAEYYWSIGAYDKIAFRFTNGFLAEYSKWREGYRIKVDGSDVKWVQSAGADESYESFVQYLKIVFAYAGTLSMESEAEEIAVSDMEVGDVFLMGGSPGHVVMIVDLCENADGSKAILLGQGYMPAQEFHLLKNPLHEDDPWYYEEEIRFPLYTPEYTFDKGSLKHLVY